MPHPDLNESRAPIIERLRVLNALVDRAGADEERHELAAERDADLLADAQ